MHIHTHTLQLAQTKASEIEGLLQRLSDVNDEMGGIIGGISDSRSHTLARHRDILQEFNQVRVGLLIDKHTQTLTQHTQARTRIRTRTHMHTHLHTDGLTYVMTDHSGFKVQRHFNAGPHTTTLLHTNPSLIARSQLE